MAVVGILVIAGALGFWLTRSKGPSTFRHHSSAVVKGSYKNRSMVTPPPDAPTAQADARPAIRGSVYDPDGNLIAGAKIVALTYDIAGNMASAAGTVSSGEDGNFEIPLNEGTYQLNVSGDGFGPTSVVAHTGDTVAVVLPTSGKINGKVVDEKGKPVRKFTVDVVSAVPGDAPAPPPLWSKSFDSKEGTFVVDQLPAWPVVVRASSPDFAPGFSPPIQLRPIDTHDLTITLTEGCTLEGKVLDKQGNPLPRVVVNAEERLTAGSVTDPVLQASMQSVSEDDGSFRLEHVPRGSVMVRGYDGDNAATSITVDAKDCSKIEPIKLVMSPGGSVEGTARTAEGKPIPGARLSIVERAVGVVNAVSDATGHFHFDDLPAGVFRIQLDHQGQSALKFVQVRENATTQIDVSLFGGGSGELKGKVVAGDKPLAGARLLVASNHGRNAGVAMYFPVTAADGSFRVPSLPAGAYLVSVMSTPAGTGVEIKKDETANLNIDVSQAYTVRAPSADAPPPREHPRRIKEWRKQREEQGEGEQPGEAAMPAP
ncbi:MAG: carboxypeptidase-like regulatory domain-containing protein [Minicystis sp.]